MSAQQAEHVVRSADGTRIGVLKLGSGPAVVVVHGAWNTSAQWLEVGKAIAAGRSCHLMDRRGRGRSGDGAEYSLDREIEDIQAVLDAAGPDASLLGHSSGAIYALEAARRHPISRLMLYEPPLHFSGSEAQACVDRVRTAVEAGRPKDATTIFFAEELRLTEDELSFLQSLPLWEEMAALAWTFVREWDALLETGVSVDRYRDVSAPTLLLAGTATRDHPSFATAELQAALPNARTTMLDGHGHGANLTASDLVAREIASFLDAPTP